MRIALKSQNAGWVIDSIVDDYKKHSKQDIVKLNENPDVFWCVNLFSYPSICSKVPSTCKKVIQLHHINESQISEYKFDIFNTADVCIVPNKITELVAKKYINIPIVRIPYWLLSNAMKDKNKENIKKIKNKISSNGEVLIGSFVKDGNGKTGNTPKLSKGPDIFIDIVEKLNSIMNIKVVLAGYSRKYVIDNLKERNIPYVYYQKYKDINTLYDCLDWYLTTSRFEGGPQSILEASYRGIKILSSRVGIAPEILHSDCICDSVDEFVNKVKSGLDKRLYNKDVVTDKFMFNNIIPKLDSCFEEILTHPPTLKKSELLA